MCICAPDICTKNARIANHVVFFASFAGIARNRSIWTLRGREKSACGNADRKHRTCQVSWQVSTALGTPEDPECDPNPLSVVPEKYILP